MPRGIRSGRSGVRRAGRWTAVVLGVLALAGSLYGGYAGEFVRQARWATDHVAGAVLAGARGAAGFVMTHPYFAVREVRVLGAEKVKGADIVVTSGLGPNTQAWSIDPGEMEERVRRHPWVKSVLVRRELPSRLVITIEEWRPAAIVALDKLYYAADNGVIFKAVDEEDSVDFPFITGLRAAGLPPHEPGTRQKLSQAVALAAAAAERTALGLSEIRFQAGGGIVLYPVSYAVPFHMGWGDWEEKLDRLRWFTTKFQGRAARFRAVDLSFRGQVVARPRGSA